MAIKLIASDVDGTLVDSQGNISPYTKQVINRLKDYNIRFVIASGRSYGGAQKVLSQLDIEREGYGLISLNGLRVYNFPSLDYRQTHTMTYEQCLWMEQLGAKYFMGVLYCFEDMVYFQMDERTYKDYEIALDRGNLRFFKENMATKDITSLAEIKDRFTHKDTILKTVFIQYEGYMQLVLDRIRREVEDIFTISLVGTGWAEVLFNDVNKGIALLEYGKKFGIGPDEIMAFGDAENDLEMLSMIPHGIAMGNAMPQVKAVASAVAKTNNEDGVAHYLAEHLGITEEVKE